MNINFDPGRRQGPIAQVVATLVAVAMLAAGLVFSVVFVAVLAVAGLLVWAWFWWKTRALRKAVREQMQAMHEASFAAQSPGPDAGASVIEGEAVRVVDEKDRLAGPPQG